jgi:hypothetical protein
LVSSIGTLFKTNRNAAVSALVQGNFEDHLRR